MGDSLESGGNLSNSNAIEVTGRIMVMAIILLLFVVIFVFCLHLYAKWYWSRRPDAATARGRRRGGTGHQERTVVSSGLNSSAQEAIPVVLFDPKQFKDGLECAVCLSEVSEGEKARLLPKCNHGFHVECIDMWFQSHSTCPICRNTVADQKSDADTTLEGILQIPVEDSNSSSDAPNLPTNVLFWGDETRVSTFGPCVEESHRGGESSSSSSASSTASTSSRPDGAVVIDIPRHGHQEEEQKSPIPSTLRSLRRLLSGNNRRVNPSSPINQDIEQGVSAQT